MKIAVQMGCTDRTADPASVAKAAEDRGFDALFFPEHTHMPVQQVDTPYTGHEQRFINYRSLYSPLISMAWAISATTRLTVGTCVALPAQHHAINLAKSLGSLDAMSGGRVVYGFGFGWLEEEMADHGVDPKRRRATVREKMMAVKTLWRDEQASFSGEFVNFPPCWCEPKPPPGRLPIMLGAGGTDQVFDHVIEYCDGWMPPLRGDVADFLPKIDRLRQRAAEQGRDPATIPIDVISGERSVPLFEKFARAGVRRVILHLPFAGIDEVRRVLDEYLADYVSVFHKD